MDNLPANMGITLERLRNQSQIVTKGSFGITGTTTNGQIVSFPDSLQRGYRDELTPRGQKPTVVWEIPGIVSLDSNGDFNFLPSYNQGRDNKLIIGWRLSCCPASFSFIHLSSKIEYTIE